MSLFFFSLSKYVFFFHDAQRHQTKPNAAEYTHSETTERISLLIQLEGFMWLQAVTLNVFSFNLFLVYNISKLHSLNITAPCIALNSLATIFRVLVSQAPLSETIMAKTTKHCHNNFAQYLSLAGYLYWQKEQGSIKDGRRTNQSSANRSCAVPHPGLKQELPKPPSSTTTFHSILQRAIYHTIDFRQARKVPKTS